ncbi:hypothetical protein AMTRI_Chr02g223250 [Amborella trichopoda]
MLSLPIKSIGRFRCACKLWHELLSSSNFIRRQCLEPPPSVPIFMASASSGFFFFNLSSILNGVQVYKTEAKFLERGRYGTLVDTVSSEGLLCYYHSRKRGDPLNFYVCNPITQDYIVIPPLHSEPSSHAFHFDPLNQIFKILVFSDQNWMGGFPTYWIFSSSIGSWKRLEGSHAPTNRLPLLCVKGTSYGITDDRKIIAFDMEREEWESINLPSNLQAKVEEHRENNDDDMEREEWESINLPSNLLAKVEEHRENNDENEDDDDFYTARLLRRGEKLCVAYRSPLKGSSKGAKLTICELRSNKVWKEVTTLTLVDGYGDIIMDHHYLFMTTCSCSIGSYTTKYDYDELYFYDLRSPDKRVRKFKIFRKDPTDGLYTSSAFLSFKPMLCAPKVTSS